MPLILSISPVSSLSFSGALPADPFVSQTALARALVAEGESTLSGIAGDGDTLTMIEAMRMTGCRVELEEEERGMKAVVIPGDRLTMPEQAIPLGNAAYTFRLLTGILSGAGVRGRLEAEAPLARRNIERLLGPLRSMGAEITSSDRGTPPVYIFPGDFRAGEIDLPIANAYLKAGLIAAARSAGVALRLSEPRPSRDHAERIFGGTISQGESYAVEIPAGSVDGFGWRLPSDTILADHLTTLAILRDDVDVRIEQRIDTPVERRLLGLLVSAGAIVENAGGAGEMNEPTTSIIVRRSTLAGELVLEGADVSGLENEIPLLAVAIGAGGGSLEVRGALNLRQQVCDRIAAIVDNLGAVGIETEEFDDGFRVAGSGIVRGGCDISAYDDPAIALAMILLLALADAPSTLHDVPDDYRCRALMGVLGSHVTVVEE